MKGIDPFGFPRARLSIPLRSRWLIALPALVLVVFGRPLPASAASAAQDVAGQIPVTAQCSGWSSTPPSQCHRPFQSAKGYVPITISPAWINNYGCGGYYTGSGEMNCRATTLTVNNFRVVVRWGFWNGSNGFGWSKAYYYHNLDIQPIIDTIHKGIPSGSDSSRNYEVYHYSSSGYIDQYVFVVADIVDPYFQNTYTIDGYSVGAITGYCDNGSGQMESQCPEWVDQTL